MVKPIGWYLGLRYMQGSGLVAREAAPIDAKYHGTQFLFVDRVLLSAANWRDVLCDWWNALAVGGHLILWLPDCRYQNLNADEARVTLDDITQALDFTSGAPSGWQMLESDIIDGHIYVVWQKRDDSAQLKTPWRKQPKHMLIARTGAHGDALMAASILPWLKDQGWTISFVSKRAGVETLRHDPHIDELIWLADGQVADEEMPYYWQAWEKRYDRFINLVYSVEGELLKIPGRPDYYWPDAQRRAHCARSYLGYTHQLAQVPGPYRVCFYPSEDEKKWAEEQASQGPFILWCLRGSALHKWWPYAPQAICRILACSNARIILSGDDESKILADAILKAVKEYYGDASRIIDRVGSVSIRQMMTLAHHAAVVVGPETGVMNAVSMQSVPKVLMLSHSAPENLPNDWINVAALKPTSSCYPCHRLHYDAEWCPQDAQTGASVCSASITIDAVVDAVLATLQKPQTTPWWLRDKNLPNAA